MATKTTAKKISHAAAERLLERALAAKPEDVKVPISLRLDSDIYMELKRRAKTGEAGGKYQALLNEILRVHLFPKQSKKVG